MIVRSLRGRVAVAAAAATAVVLVLGGGLVTVLVGNAEYRSLDRRLADQAAVLDSPVSAATVGHSDLDRVEVAVTRPDVGTALRLAQGDRSILAIGAPGVVFPLPAHDGYQTLAAGARSWRLLTRTIPSNNPSNTQPLVLQAAVPVEPTRELEDTLRRRTLQIALLSAALAGLGGWLLGEVALRPLARLRLTAEQVAHSRDLSARVPVGDGPVEVDALAASVNTMLERIQDATASTEMALASSRTFAGNAAHELRTPLTSMQANLDILNRNPNLPADQRGEVVSAITTEQRRLVALLEALHVLARGDVVAEGQKEPMDMADLVGVAVEAARRRHPAVEFSAELSEADVPVLGWPDGLRVMVDNLLNNAARHGGTHVQVVLHGGPTVQLVVDDDGPGVPVEERMAIFDRFVRGSNAKTTGSGLGLALVAQQARLHGGDVEATDSPLGGARFTVHLAGFGS